MKNRSTLVVVFAATLAPILMSHHDGVAEHQNKDRTGAPGSQNPCNNTSCHTAGAFDPQLEIEVIDLLTETSITEYLPGQTYQLRFTVNSTGAAVHGFQATALFDNTENAGTFQNPGDFVQLEDVGGRHIIEHSDKNPSPVFLGEWVAPESGNGDVIFYASGLAANDSGTDSGDGYDGATLTISEAAVGIQESKLEFSSRLVNGILSINAGDAGNVSVFDPSGRLILHQFVQAGSHELSLMNRASGIYIINFSSGEHALSKKLMAL
ncbi:MAG: T9SS type A sorting domain-containing protein [Flavobacteriales bacterium]|nr:T9SS type A sorting domain-containing protein [Flavobacteriales bacterium]